MLANQITLTLSPELDRRLDQLAKAAGHTKPDYALAVLAEYAADQDDVLIAEERLANLRAGKSEASPLADVLRRHGLAD